MNQWEMGRKFKVSVNNITILTAASPADRRLPDCPTALFTTTDVHMSYLCGAAGHCDTFSNSVSMPAVPSTDGNTGNKGGDPNHQRSATSFSLFDPDHHHTTATTTTTTTTTTEADAAKAPTRALAAANPPHPIACNTFSNNTFRFYGDGGKDYVPSSSTTTNGTSTSTVKPHHTATEATAAEATTGNNGHSTTVDHPHLRTTNNKVRLFFFVVVTFCVLCFGCCGRCVCDSHTDIVSLSF